MRRGGLILAGCVLAACLSGSHTLQLPGRRAQTRQPTVAPRGTSTAESEPAAQLRKALRAAVVGAGLAFAAANPSPAFAASELAEVGVCLLRSCPGALSRCLFDIKCAANVFCLNNCGSKSGLEKTACQIKCGDQLEDEVVGEFNKCAVSEKRCVKRVKDDGSYPALPPSATVKDFDARTLKGRWYISAGLNPLFDTFDCQVHFFNAPSADQLTGTLTWRIKEPDGEYFTRSAVQMFKKSPENGGLLLNHDNEYLHYQDDWYVLDYEPKEFVLVYYRGSNDAWDGYGGGVVYSKSPTLDAKWFPRLEAACKKANIDWKQFQLTDNSCKKIDDSKVEELRLQFAERLLKKEEAEVASTLTSLRGTVANVVKEDVKGVESALAGVEKIIIEDETEAVAAAKGLIQAFGDEIEVEKLKIEATPLGRTVETGVWELLNENKLDGLLKKF